MRTTTGARRPKRPGEGRTERRWRPGFFLALSSAVLIPPSAFAQHSPARVSIRPTGPLPGSAFPEQAVFVHVFVVLKFICVETS
jgi:hypothetical protein